MHSDSIEYTHVKRLNHVLISTTNMACNTRLSLCIWFYDLSTFSLIDVYRSTMAWTWTAKISLKYFIALNFDLEMNLVARSSPIPFGQLPWLLRTATVSFTPKYFAFNISWERRKLILEYNRLEHHYDVTMTSNRTRISSAKTLDDQTMASVLCNELDMILSHNLGFSSWLPCKKTLNMIIFRWYHFRHYVDTRNVDYTLRYFSFTDYDLFWFPKGIDWLTLMYNLYWPMLNNL